MSTIWLRRSLCVKTRWRLEVPNYGSRTLQRRSLQLDHRNRLSNIWTPIEGLDAGANGIKTSHDLLVQAGFVRQTHAGIFHLLPLGLRVQDKIERLIDKHMRSIGASKVSLSSISSQQLWQTSGRLDPSRDSDFLKFEDRKGAKFLLSPTHEEEITNIVAGSVHSWRDLPLRLYQVSRKYRDEPRPRQGLLRGREFVMKDLYTFDIYEESAIATYEDVRKAYMAFFEELNLPYLVASADSGNMGGNLSHEFHLESPLGEDTIISCSQCDYTVNEEKFVASPQVDAARQASEISATAYRSKHDNTAICVLWPGSQNDVNTHIIKRLASDVDTGRPITQAEDLKDLLRVRILIDPRISSKGWEVIGKLPLLQHIRSNCEVTTAMIDGRPAPLTRAFAGEQCPSCQSGQLRTRQAIEIGHTFHLGTRYTAPLGAQCLDPAGRNVTLSMGCHGIGVSRLLAASASLLMDQKGFGWPYAIAPFGIVIVPGPKTRLEDAYAVYDELLSRRSSQNNEVVIDDRDKPMGWKLNDADLIGYPFIVILGREWQSEKRVEVQCRRLGLKDTIHLDQLFDMLRTCIRKL